MIDSTLHAGLATEVQTSADVQRTERLAEREEASRSAAEAFEAIFIQQVFGEMRSSMPGSAEGGLSEDFYSSMLDQEVAEEAAAHGGIGLADVLMRAWGLEERPPKTVLVRGVPMLADPTPPEDADG